MSRRFAFVVAIAFSALVVTSGSSAAPSDLFFSEYIEGTSNNKALEIYNGTGAAIDLTAGAYVVQMYFNGSATAGLTITLAGTVAAGDVFVLAHASSNATILAQADLTNGAGWFNGDDAVVLRKGGAGGTILDVVGQVGVDPGTEWGSLLASTADNTLRRKAAVEAGDLDGSNAFDPSLEWDGLATDDARGARRSPDRHRAVGGEHCTHGRREHLSERIRHGDFQRGGQRHGQLVHDVLHDERRAHGNRVGRPDDLHARPGRRLRRRRQLHRDGGREPGQRPGRDRPA